jgi:filamentous hemagglutinin family protein
MHPESHGCAGCVSSLGVPGVAAVIRRAVDAVIPSALALLVAATGSSAEADDSIKADSTLNPNTLVTRSMEGGKTTYTISGGAARNSGRYLFHSFQSFNLLQNEVGHFNNLDSVHTIFGRVTGISPSNIDGLIKANGAANLFLINPNGIVFGPNARIDVGGAFKASTAAALDFNGQLFSASTPQDAPLLTSGIVPGLQYGTLPATLENQGELVVKDGQEILLAGGPLDTVISSGTIGASGGAVSLEGGNITVSSGTIQADGGTINIRGENSVSIYGSSLSALSTATSNTSVPHLISVFGLNVKIGREIGRTILRAGNAQLRSENEKSETNLTLLESVFVNAIGPVTISGDSIQINKGFISSSSGTTLSNAKDGLGDIVIADSTISAFGPVTISGNSIQTNKGFISSFGPGGNIDLHANDVNLEDSSISSFASNINPGDITIKANNFRLNGSGLATLGFGAKAGAIYITSNRSVTLSGESSEMAFPSRILSDSGIFINTSKLRIEHGGGISGEGSDINIVATESVSLAGTNSYGTSSSIGSPMFFDPTRISGKVSIDTSVLTIEDGGIINASAINAGSSGDISISAKESITLMGRGLFGNPSAISNEVLNSTGEAGTIIIQTPALMLRDGGLINASLTGVGTAGAIQINAEDSVTLVGGASTGSPSSIKSTVNSGSNGFSRGIMVSSPRVNLSEGATIDASTLGDGNAGDIWINTQLLTLSNGSGITAFTRQGTGDAGTISVNSHTLAISGGSEIKAFTEGAGNGGYVYVDAAQAVDIADGSGITVEASSTGKPGTIDIFTGSLTIGEDALLSASTKGTSTIPSQGGSVNLYASNLDISGRLGIFAETQSQSPAGNLTIKPYGENPDLGIRFRSNGFISALTNSSGLGGNVTIIAPNSIEIRGSGKITTETSGSGNAGSVHLTGQNLHLSEGVSIGVSTSSTGHAGEINLQANNIKLDQGTRLSAETNGAGNGGSINLKGYSISLDNGALAAANTSDSGKGGNITLTANTITLDHGAKLSTSSGGTFPLSTGPAGSISITATGPNSLHLRNGSQISSDTSSSSPWTNDNDLANIVINTPHLSLEGASSISANTSAAAKAGAINMISPWIELTGGSTIATASTGSGAGGDISIRGTRLHLSSASQIKADGGINGQAGSININLRDRLLLENKSSINASTARSTSKQGGANISISLGGDLLLSNGSSITASATGKANGGNIKLLLPNGFLLSSFPGAFDGNDILASADEGDGGRIEVRALGIFGMNINTFFTPISEASAKSRSGRDGVLAFYIPLLTPDRGVVPIEQPLDPDNDLVRVCSPRGDGRRAEFTQTGRGGLPSLPGDRPTAAPLLDDLGRPAPSQGVQSSSSLPNATFLPTPATTIPIASAIQPQDPAQPLALPLPPCPEPR